MGTKATPSKILLRQVAVRFLSDSEEFLVELCSADWDDQGSTWIELER